MLDEAFLRGKKVRHVVIIVIEGIGEGSRALMGLQQIFAHVPMLRFATGVDEGLCYSSVPAPSNLQEHVYEGPCDADVRPQVGPSHVFGKRGECGTHLAVECAWRYPRPCNTTSSRSNVALPCPWPVTVFPSGD